MYHASGDSIRAKKAFATITWDKGVLTHKVWSLCTRSIPLKLKTNSVVHDRQCKINQKIMTSSVVIQIPFSLFLANTTFHKKTHHNIRWMDHPVQCPAENSQGNINSCGLLSSSLYFPNCFCQWHLNLQCNQLVLVEQQ
jgi:hypothetical protein